MEKRRFIKDQIWGNIEIYPWEKPIFDHYILNRLHNVVQNSTAFRVYPTLKYSRFAHSVGAMHVATNIFTNIVLNTYLEKEAKDKDVEKLLQDESKLANDYVTSKSPKLLSLIRDRIPFSDGLNNHSILLAAIRIAALLHDIGHMPYSHVFEFALHQLFKSFNCDEEATGNNHSRCLEGEPEKRLCALVYCSKTNNVNKKGSLKKIHELLGYSFINMLSKDISPRCSQEVNPFALIEVARDILYSEKFPISASLLTGTVESDRIDFIRRDGEISGLFKSSVDYGRLFSFYKLELVDGKVRAFPSNRAKSESEKLLWERFMVYKYIAAHHKVHLYDELLERFIFLSIISKVFKEQIGALCNLISLPDKSDNSSLTTYEENKLQESRKKIILNLLTKFDDPWLDMSLRDAYCKTYLGATGEQTERPHAKSVAVNHEERVDKKKRHIFEAINERRNLFIPICKTDEDFAENFSPTIEKATTDIIKYEKLHRKSNPICKGEIVDCMLTYFNKNKYKWEDEFGDEYNIDIIWGDISHKLSIGIKAEDLLGLSDLHKFLGDKKISSTLFNIWYSAEALNAQRDAKAIKELILNHAKNKIDEFVGIHKKKDHLHTKTTNKKLSTTKKNDLKKISKKGGK